MATRDRPQTRLAKVDVHSYLSSPVAGAVVLLMVGGVLNVIYGIAAIGNSSFFVHNTHYVFSNLKTWGWIA